MNGERVRYFDVQVSCDRAEGLRPGILNGVYSIPKEGQALLDLLSEKKRACEENNGSCRIDCPINQLRESLKNGTYNVTE